MKDEKILFCNIISIEDYKKDTDEDNYAPDRFKGKAYNFNNYYGDVYGYVQPLESVESGGEWLGDIDTKIDISRLGDSVEDKTSNVLVVWTGQDGEDGFNIIGWYKDASVFRDTQIYYNEMLNKKIGYRIIADYEDAYLLEEKNRVFKVPNKNKNISGMDQSNLWFLGEDKKDKEVYEFEEEYGKKVINYIDRVGDYLKIDRKKLTKSEEEGLMRKRIGEGKFRKELLKASPKCRLCGLEEEDLLIACHIKPWDQSSEFERMDPENGFLLCPNHEYLFTNYLMSFSNNGNIMISNDLDDRARVMVNIFGDLSIKMTAKEKEYMEYHREIFLEEK